MPDATAAVHPLPIASARELLPWALLAGLLLVGQLYLAGVEQGATSLFGGQLAHEYVHDARHVLGLPCD